MLDADALYALRGRLATLAMRPAPTALTPHAGELARLLGVERDVVSAARLESVQRAAAEAGCAVLLKGPDTLIAAPGEPLRVVETAVPGLATAGAGDVLSGVVGALLARGLEPAEALSLAAAAHGAAAAGAAGAARDVLGLRPRAAAGPLARTVTRLHVEVDESAITANARRLSRAARASRAVGGRQGRRLRARGRAQRTGGARGRRDPRRRRDARRGAGASRRRSAPAVPILVLGPLEAGRAAEAQGLEVCISTPDARERLHRGRVPRQGAREGRHRHGALGADGSRTRSRSAARSRRASCPGSSSRA